ncbi:MAG TPA: TetR/AcrR family transcriptional regulator [Allosphingosinicella sp.]
MRRKSDEKRREIVRVAARAFEELGYERTSMLTIAERLRGSKQTLYNYFPSKEDLLRAVLDFDVGEVADRALEEFRSEKDLRGALTRLGIVFLNGQLAPAAMSNIRIVATQPAESNLGRDFYEKVLRPAWLRTAEAFGSLMDEGKLRKSDPWLAAMQWKGLVLLDLFERRLLGAMTDADPKEIEAAARQAADAFLRIYGPSEAAPKSRRRS